MLGSAILHAVATYVAVLKGKPGELTACRAASAAVLAGSRVVFEIVPKYGAERDLTDFVNRMAKGAAPLWPAGAIPAIDMGYMDQSQRINGTGVVLWAAQQLLNDNVRSIPVMRHDDPAPVLADIASAVKLIGGGVCLRLGSSDDDPSSDIGSGLIPAAMKAVGVAPPDTDLLIDMWTITSKLDRDRAVPSAVAALQWAAANGPFRTVTLVSGAFPDSISNFDKDQATTVFRWDADFYREVVHKKPALVPDFGDYGPASPAIPPDKSRAPLPNLRYTDEDEWQVYRESKKRPGNESFYTLCGRVVKTKYWRGAGYSWGDREIERCSRSQPGPGTATEWRAYGTSHHLARVVDRLSTTGAP
jgi:hypothetical protein